MLACRHKAVRRGVLIQTGKDSAIALLRAVHLCRFESLQVFNRGCVKPRADIGILLAFNPRRAYLAAQQQT
jgi:hypothetical protein